MPSRLQLALGCAAALLSLATSARAEDAGAPDEPPSAAGKRTFCRTTTLTDKDPSSPTTTRCAGEEGKPLFWKSRCVGYNLERIASRKVSYDDASRIIAGAFAKWTQAACAIDGDGPSRVSIDVRDLGEVQCGEVGYDKLDKNQNVIVFRDDGWPHKDTSAIALTTVTYNTQTGEIFDADMEVNTFFFPQISLAAIAPAGSYDFDSVATHEAGHFLGIAHSPEKESTMYFSYVAGEMTKRYLKTTDIAGICSAYLPNGNRVTAVGNEQAGGVCDPIPRRGLTRTCETPSGLFKCDSSGQSSSAWFASPLLMIVAGAIARMRRRPATLG